MPTFSYPTPIYSQQNASGVSTGLSIDIGDANIVGFPPVLICVISATATVLVEGSHDNVNWVDFSAGGFTSSFAKDLVIGVRFWRTRTTANTGTVTSSTGTVPKVGGGLVNLRNPAIENNITAGQ